MKNSGFFLCLITAILVPSLSICLSQAKTLTRTEDYIIIKGGETPSLIGVESSDLHLYACGRSGFRAVPFQVDKRDAEDRYVFPNEVMRDPQRDGSLLDSNDEMVFMVKDAGNRCPEAAWPESAEKGVEIEVSDPRNNGRAWVYVFYQPGAEAPKTDDYAKYMVEGGAEIISGRQYQIGKGLNMVAYNHLRLLRPDGSWSEDLLEEQKIGLQARLLNGLIPLHVPEQDVKVRIIGVIDGPVRVIRDELKLVRINVIGWEMISDAFHTYYGNGFVSPMKVDIPFTISKLFVDIDLYWGFSFTRAILGSTYLNPSNPDGIMLDGKPDERMEVESDNDYFLICGPAGAIVEIMDLGNLGDYDVIRTTLVYEGPKEKKPPMDHAGEVFAGIWIKNTKRMPKGTYHYSHHHFYPYPYSEARVRGVLDTLEHPVEIKVHPLVAPSIQD